LNPEQLTKAGELSRNTLAILMKHNLVRTSQEEYEQSTLYSLDAKECILRLSLPRYLIKVQNEMSHVHASIIEALFIHGSLLKSEVVTLLLSNESLKRAAVEKALEDLIQLNFVTGAHSYQQLTSGETKKKR